jgi:hypothetical protein
MKALFGVLVLISFLQNEANAFSKSNATNELKAQTFGVLASLPVYMLGCYPTKSNFCKLKPNEITILTSIYNAFDKEFKTTEIQFLSGKDHPQIFNLGGAPRIAVTNTRSGAPIQLNLDLLIDSKSGAVISRQKMIAFLVHEFGHHLGIDDTQERVLDSIGAGVANLYAAKSESIDLASSNLPNIGGYIYNNMDYESLKKVSERAYRFPEIRFHLGDAIQNFDTQLLTLITLKVPECPTKESIQLAYVSNLHWMKLPALNAESYISTIANLKLMCGSSMATAKELTVAWGAFGPLIKQDGEFVIDKNRSLGGVTKTPILTETNEATVQTVSTNTTSLHNGGLWSGKVNFTVSQDLPYVKCLVSLSAVHMLKDADGQTMGLAIEKCELKRIAPNQYELNFSENFTPARKSATYFVNDLRIETADGQSVLYLDLPVRKTVDLVNDHENKSQILDVKFYDKDMKECPNGIHGFKQGESFTVLVHIKDFPDLIDLQFATQGNGITGGQFSGFETLYRKGVNKKIQISVDVKNPFTLAIRYTPSKDFSNVEWYQMSELNILDQEFNALNLKIPEAFKIYPN